MSNSQPSDATENTNHWYLVNLSTRVRRQGRHRFGLGCVVELHQVCLQALAAGATVRLQRIEAGATSKVRPGQPERGDPATIKPRRPPGQRLGSLAPANKPREHRAADAKIDRMSQKHQVTAILMLQALLVVVVAAALAFEAAAGRGARRMGVESPR